MTQKSNLKGRWKRKPSAAASQARHDQQPVDNQSAPEFVGAYSTDSGDHAKHSNDELLNPVNPATTSIHSIHQNSKQKDSQRPHRERFNKDRFEKHPRHGSKDHFRPNGNRGMKDEGYSKSNHAPRNDRDQSRNDREECQTACSLQENPRCFFKTMFRSIKEWIQGLTSKKSSHHQGDKRPYHHRGNYKKHNRSNRNHWKH